MKGLGIKPEAPPPLQLGMLRDCGNGHGLSVPERAQADRVEGGALRALHWARGLMWLPCLCGSPEHPWSWCTIQGRPAVPFLQELELRVDVDMTRPAFQRYVSYPCFSDAEPER